MATVMVMVTDMAMVAMVITVQDTRLVMAKDTLLSNSYYQ